MQSHNRNTPSGRHVRYEPVNSDTDPVIADDAMTSAAMGETSGEREDCLLECNIAFLGTSKVGKTSVLRQFIHLDFEEGYTPSTTCTKYRKAVYMDGRIYDMTLRDCPGVSYFPTDSLSEWSDYKGYALHSSQVYVLVYDTSNEDTFNYVRKMREQILEIKKDEAMIVVVGNKQDLTDSKNEFLKSHMQHVARKWKCPFVFCSAKYNWHVVKVFQEILKAIESEIDSKKVTGMRNNNRWTVNLNNCKIS